MGKRGPQPRPIRELKLAGTFRGDRHGHFIAPPEKLVALSPQQYLIDPEAPVDRAAIFEFFARELHQAGQSQSVDTILLGQLVEAQALYIDALRISRRDPNATIGRKLASQIVLLAGSEVRRLMGEFRLTPSTRQRVERTSQPTAVIDPIGQFLALPSK